jgi:hypothetical protein
MSSTICMEFRCRKGNQLDVEISKLIIKHNINFPILIIKDQLYLIGPGRYSCVLRGDIPMVRVGGGY